MNNTEISILVGGDVMPLGKNQTLFTKNVSNQLFSDFVETIRICDLFVINLESPFIFEEKPISRNGPIFGAPVNCVAGLAGSGIAGVNLANNHIMDHGEEGLHTTLEVLQANGIFHFGAGENLELASQLQEITLKDKRIGFLGMADREFSIAGRDKPGANPSDVIQFRRIIRQYRADLDYLIVFLHEGVQHFRFPTPELQDRCRFMVEEGADAVICQHSHCSGCFEIYQERPIIYGQGDLLSDSRSPLKDDTGFFVKLSLGEGIGLSIMPYVQLEVGGIRDMTDEERRDFIEQMGVRNEILLDPIDLENVWREHCRLLQDTYYARIYGFNRVFAALIRKLHFVNYVSAKRAAILLNLVRCHAHREALEMIFSDLFHEKTLKGDFR